MYGKSRSAIICALAAATLAACASVSPPPKQWAEGDEVITLENTPGPFCGRCDSVKITAVSDGRVWIESGYWAGAYRNWRVERRLESGSPEMFARFREHLRPYRPNGQLSLQDKPPCATFAHDVDGVLVEWRDKGGTDMLSMSFGCDPEIKKAMANGLRAAPNVLGIPDLDVAWGQWLATTSD